MSSERRLAPRWMRVLALPGLLTLAACAPQRTLPPALTSPAASAPTLRIVPVQTLGTEFGIVDPKDCAIDASGRLLVLDGTGPDLIVLDPDGHFLDRWPVSGLGARPFFRPKRVTTTGLSILLLDPEERWIVRLDRHGEFQGEALDLSATSLATELGFVEPDDLAADSAGQLYVSDREGSRVLGFDVFSNLRVVMGGFGSSGRQLRVPTGLDVDRSGRVFVVDTGNGRIVEFDAFGASLGELQLPPTETGRRPIPIAVATHPDGHLLVLDDAGRLVVLTGRGAVLATHPIGSAKALVAHPNGRVFVLALAPPRIESVDLEAI
jgi:streptogramin lyase